MKLFLINPHCSFPVALEILIKPSGIYSSTSIETEALHHFLTFSCFFPLIWPPIHLAFLFICADLQLGVRGSFPSRKLPPNFQFGGLFPPEPKELQTLSVFVSYWVTVHSLHSLNFRSIPFFFFFISNRVLQNLFLSLCVFLTSCNIIVTSKVNDKISKIFTVPSVLDGWIK